MNISRYVKIGIFFLSIGTAGTVYIIRSTDGFNDLNTKVYEIAIDDATGLSTNSKVYLAGVPVGKIKTIDLSGGSALLRVAFLKSIEIRQDATIQRKPSSILGTSILALSPGTEYSPVLKPGSRLEAVRGAGDTSAILGSAQELTKQISGLLKEFQERQLELLAVSLETFNTMAKKLNDRSDAELERISRILESSALITERFEKILREREGDITTSTTDVKLALENIRQMTEEIRSGEGNIGKAIYDEKLYASLLSTAERTEAAAAKLQETLDSFNTLAVNSNKVVTDAGTIVTKAAGLGVQVDSIGRYDVLASTFKAGASLRLEPASQDRYYRIGVSSAPAGSTASYVLDAEIARRIGWFTLRGGLYEGFAGLGLDITPAASVQLSAEAFDFQKNGIPNLRGTLYWYPAFNPLSPMPWNWLYLYGGVNAALDPRRDFFVGMGIRFADEEVRGLVGLIPLGAGK
jgi:phospholipid/cholesterol/gamma-HCH transport system substrate-binding protein